MFNTELQIETLDIIWQLISVSISIWIILQEKHLYYKIRYVEQKYTGFIA